MIADLLQVHVDDEVPIPTSARKAQDSFCGALKDKSVVPTKLNPQTLFERENPKVKLMCDLNKIMVGHREFSFEEIRRQCYEKSGRSIKLAPPEILPITPISSAALLNVRSKEKNAKNRTPSDTAAIQKVKTPKRVAKPPPLKPNEKWHCDIDALYPESRELTFEQLRAQYYATRISARAAVEPEIVPVEVPPVVEAQPEPVPVPVRVVIQEDAPVVKKNVPATCEIAVQTDIFGLDFDIQLVPRKKATTPPSRKTPSPPPAAEQNSGVGGGGSSPTVNTKQALSSVKSWFNSSRLVPEAKPEPKPAKKSLFAIFKDPSVVDVLDERAAPGPKPFTVFCEPEAAAGPPVQAKKFTIMDENVPVDQENAVSHVPVPKVRRPLAAIVPLPTCPENPVPVEEDVEENFKENVPPINHVQETVKRQLSGVLVPSVDIPCDPVGLVEEDIDEEQAGSAVPVITPSL